MKSMFAAVLIAAPLSILAALPATAQMQQPTKFRGTIQAVQGDTLTYQVRDGATMTVRMTPETRITAVSGTSLSEIKPGSYIGVGAEPEKDGTQRALEVHIFTEAQRGTGEGFHSFDLTPNSTMTNGTVADDMPPAGQVTQNDSNDARRILTLTYKGGQQKVVVPDDAPIVKLAPGSRDLVVAGAKANISGYKAPDGSVTATTMNVGTNGLTPPM
ncbi:MAG TPA: DUF5666 domain-containing protein [Alphaproteobacteria bacterium]|jgi:hypothetical protein